ncbi:MAG TPA: sigma-70 family RNA polymerase sigma factor [Thermoanaerobaculia bacterium]|nr:sigma-70 family RNA polymerase sigma factor [Thermoanaerobaculia bacterium]
MTHVDLYSFDDEYVRRLADGDRTTEEHFLRYFQELLLIKLRGRVRSMQDIDDIRQEVFLRVFRALHSAEGIQDGRKLGAFVNGVCNNVLLEWYRTDNRTEPLPDEALNLPDQGVSADEALDRAETVEHVHRVIEKLPSKDAAILRAIFLKERDKDQICSEFGVDRDYLRVLLHRAKERFRSEYRGAKIIRFPKVGPGIEPPEPWPSPWPKKGR